MTIEDKNNENTDDEALTGKQSGDQIENVSMSEIALDMARKHCSSFFVDEYRVPHAAISVKDHIETIPIRGKRFKNWLANMIYKETQTVIESQTLNNAINILSACAEFDNDITIKLNLRVAQSKDKDGKTIWYYDLTNQNWEYIEITSAGWKITKDLLMFHRYNNQLPQVYPSRDYDHSVFDKFIAIILNKDNIDEEKLEQYTLLLKCYIICAFIPDFPKCIILPHGPQGSAKTSLMEFIKLIIDPSVVKTLSFPRDVNELNQQLSHNYVAYYDNVSSLKDLISDELCRAVSGSGSSVRVLYTDDDDFIRSFMRCIGFNGINLAATKPDLLDRAILFLLKRIAQQNRRYVIDLQKEIEDMRPDILGYILDILVKVLQAIEKNGMLKLQRIPRMADWAVHCEIISRCMDNDDGKFIRAYEENAKIQIEEIIESSLIAICLTYYLDTDARFNINEKDEEGKPMYGYEGTTSQLKEKLDEIAETLKIDTNSKGWAKAPNILSRRLRELEHTLRDAGIEIVFERRNGRCRTIKIRKLSSQSSQSSSVNTRIDNSGDKIDVDNE